MIFSDRRWTPFSAPGPLSPRTEISKTAITTATRCGHSLCSPNTGRRLGSGLAGYSRTVLNGPARAAFSSRWSPLAGRLVIEPVGPVGGRWWSGWLTHRHDPHQSKALGGGRVGRAPFWSF